MHMRIVQQVNGLLTGLCTRLSTLVTERLLPNVNKLRASITQAFLSAANQLFQLVQTALNIRAWPVLLTTAVRSIKAVLTSVLAKVTRLGQQPATTAPSTSQPAPQAPLRKRGRPVGSTKSAQSHSQKTTPAQTPTVRRLTQDGVKSPGRVGLPHQRAKSQSKKGK